MKVEIELHAAASEAGDTVRVRIVREFADDGTVYQQLIRLHDSGEALSPSGEPGVFVAADGTVYTLTGQIA